MKRIFRLMAVMVAVFLSFLAYVHWSKTRELNSGEVHVRQQPDDDAKPSTPDAAPAPNPPAQSAEAAPSSPDTSESASADQSGSQPQNAVVTLPAAQNISRNPPNGLVGVGTGKFELYRQGDITWRMNTETGDACILFATEAQWRKSLVYEHGCATQH